MLRKILDAHTEEVLANFPDAQIVAVRDIEPFKWCDAFDKHLTEVREEGARIRFYAYLRWMAFVLERKVGWAAVVYKEEHGAWPPWDWKDTVQPMQPDEDFEKWFKKREAKNVREFKKQKKRERASRFQPDFEQAGWMEGEPGDQAGCEPGDT